MGQEVHANTDTQKGHLGIYHRVFNTPFTRQVQGDCPHSHLGRFTHRVESSSRCYNYCGVQETDSESGGPQLCLGESLDFGWPKIETVSSRTLPFQNIVGLIGENCHPRMKKAWLLLQSGGCPQNSCLNYFITWYPSYLHKLGLLVHPALTLISEPNHRWLISHPYRFSK